MFDWNSRIQPLWLTVCLSLFLPSLPAPLSLCLSPSLSLHFPPPHFPPQSFCSCLSTFLLHAFSSFRDTTFPQATLICCDGVLVAYTWTCLWRRLLLCCCYFHLSYRYWFLPFFPLRSTSTHLDSTSRSRFFCLETVLIIKCYKQVLVSLLLFIQEPKDSLYITINIQKIK